MSITVMEHQKLTYEQLNDLWDKAENAQGDQAYLQGNVIDLINDLIEARKEIANLVGLLEPNQPEPKVGQLTVREFLAIRRKQREQEG